MKSVSRSIATIFAISAIAAGSASAMIPKADLKQNAYPDAGVAPKFISDLESGTVHLPGVLVGSGDQTVDESTQTGTKELRDLVGKHFI